MALTTTTIGAYPERNCVATMHWFSLDSTTGPASTSSNDHTAIEAVEMLDRKVGDVVAPAGGLGA